MDRINFAYTCTKERPCHSCRVYDDSHYPLPISFATYPPTTPLYQETIDGGTIRASALINGLILNEYLKTTKLKSFVVDVTAYSCPRQLCLHYPSIKPLHQIPKSPKIERSLSNFRKLVQGVGLAIDTRRTNFFWSDERQSIVVGLVIGSLKGVSIPTHQLPSIKLLPYVVQDRPMVLSEIKSSTLF